MSKNLSMPPEGFARLQQVLPATGVQRTCWYEMIRRGEAPRPLKLGPRISVWKVEEVRAWIAERAAAGQQAKKAA